MENPLLLLSVMLATAGFLGYQKIAKTNSYVNIMNKKQLSQDTKRTQRKQKEKQKHFKSIRKIRHYQNGDFTRRLTIS